VLTRKAWIKPWQPSDQRRHQVNQERRANACFSPTATGVRKIVSRIIRSGLETSFTLFSAVNARARHIFPCGGGI
jgi:hypothetical protein